METITELDFVHQLQRELSAYLATYTQPRVADSEAPCANRIGTIPIYPGVAAAGSVRVPATTLDRLADTQDLTRLDIVKLDLEGAELRALTGAQDTLRRWRPLVLFECNQPALERQGGSVAELLRLFNDCGYRILSFDPVTGKPVPLAGNPPSDDLVAVHRQRDWGLPAD